MKAEDAQQLIYKAMSTIRTANTKEVISSKAISEDPEKAYKEGVESAILALDNLRETILTSSKSLKDLGING